MAVNLHLDDVYAGFFADNEWLSTNRFVFQIPECDPVEGLVVKFKLSPNSSFQFTLQRETADFAAELKSAIATYAAINIRDIKAIACDGVDLCDRYEVANLHSGDVLDVTLAAGVSPRVTMMPVAMVSPAVSTGSQKRSAPVDEDIASDQTASSAKRNKH